jgi:hypothetical protein
MNAGLADKGENAFRKNSKFIRMSRKINRIGLRRDFRVLENRVSIAPDRRHLASSQQGPPSLERLQEH